MALKTEKYLNYEIKIITSFSEIVHIKNDWENILDEQNSVNVYLDPNFYQQQFDTRSPDSSPYIAAFYQDSQLVGIIIAKTVSKSLVIKLGYINISTPKFKKLEIEIDGIIASNNSTAAEDMFSFLNTLVSKRIVEIIEFEHFSERNLIWNELNESVKYLRNISFPGREYISQIRNSEDGKQNIFHKAKTIRNFRRADRIINEHFKNLELKEYSKFELIDEFLVNSEKICRNSYHCELGVGIENNDYWKRNLMNMMRGNYFLGFILFADNEPVAYNFGLIYKNYFYGFNMSFDLAYRSLQPGSFLLRRMIENLVEKKIDYFHLGYGEAEYKKLYSSMNCDEATFRLFGDTLKIKFYYYLLIVNSFINKKIINILTDAGLLNKIKKLWRSKITSRK
jgi:hypothetical protein